MPFFDSFVFTCDADQINSQLCRNNLCESEVQNHLEINKPHSAYRFIVRAVLRKHLGNILGVAPNSLTFVQNEFGKPYLEGSGSELYFNVSHSDEYGMVNITDYGEVGVDIQLRRSRTNILQIAERYFSSKEVEHAKTSDDTESALWHIWSLKEATLKSDGSGMHKPLDTYQFFRNDQNSGWNIELGKQALEDTNWQINSTQIGHVICAHALRCNYSELPPVKKPKIQQASDLLKKY